MSEKKIGLGEDYKEVDLTEALEAIEKKYVDERLRPIGLPDGDIDDPSPEMLKMFMMVKPSLPDFPHCRGEASALACCTCRYFGGFFFDYPLGGGKIERVTIGFPIHIAKGAGGEADIMRANGVICNVKGPFKQAIKDDGEALARKHFER